VEVEVEVEVVETEVLKADTVTQVILKMNNIENYLLGVSVMIQQRKDYENILKNGEKL
jgi:hypothetical protein